MVSEQSQVKSRRETLCTKNHTGYKLAVLLLVICSFNSYSNPVSLTWLSFSSHTKEGQESFPLAMTRL